MRYKTSNKFQKKTRLVAVHQKVVAEIVRVVVEGTGRIKHKDWGKHLKSEKDRGAGVDCPGS